MKKIELVPFGTNDALNGFNTTHTVHIAFICDFDVNMHTVEEDSESLVPAILMNQLPNGKIGFFSESFTVTPAEQKQLTKQYGNELIDIVMPSISEKTNAVINIGTEKFVSLCSYRNIVDSNTNLIEYDHYFYVKIKYSSMKALMQSIIESKLFGKFSLGTTLIPLSISYGVSNFINMLNTNNPNDDLFDALLMLTLTIGNNTTDGIESALLIDYINQIDKKKLSDYNKNTNAEKKELDLYRIPMTNIQTLEYREPRYRLTPEQAQQIGAVKVFDDNAVKVYASAATAAAVSIHNALSDTVDENILLREQSCADIEHSSKLEHVTVQEPESNVSRYESSDSDSGSSSSSGD